MKILRKDTDLNIILNTCYHIIYNRINMFEDFESQLTREKITIHVQKRNNSKYFTIISGWPEDINVKKNMFSSKEKSTMRWPYC